MSDEELRDELVTLLLTLLLQGLEALCDVLLGGIVPVQSHAVVGAEEVTGRLEGGADLVRGELRMHEPQGFRRRG